MGPRNPNFDPAIRMSWNQFHWEYYQILIPMTIHWLKLELKRLRYWENCEKHISMLPKIITFDLTVGILISLFFWKLYIHSFPGTPRFPQSQSGKTSKGTSEVKTKKVRHDEWRAIARWIEDLLSTKSRQIEFFKVLLRIVDSKNTSMDQTAIGKLSAKQKFSWWIENLLRSNWDKF